MKIAVASSGLGRVLRGIETSCLELARALHERGVDVTLFAAGEIADHGLQTADDRRQTTDNGQRTTDHSLLTIHYSPLPVVVLPCVHRDSRAARLLGRLSPWWGLKNGYAWEQFTFWLSLWPHLRRGRFDILHVQDPMLAWWCMRFRGAGLVRTDEVLGYGLPSGITFLRKMNRVLFLTPWHLDEALRELGTLIHDGADSGSGTNGRTSSVGEGGLVSRCGTQDGAHSPSAGQPEAFSAGKPDFWTVIPHLVDTNVFRPEIEKTMPQETSGSAMSARSSLRLSLGIPPGCFVVGTVAAVRRPHKRIDYLIREFAAFASNQRINKAPPFLLVCGARTEESDGLVKLAEELAPGQAKFLFDVPVERMPDIYRAMDVFVLASLWETFGLCITEAMSSGLPVIVSNHPSIQWIVSQGSCHAAAGAAIDMGREGALAEFLAGLTRDWIEQHGLGARERAEATFSRDVVSEQLIEYYLRVVECSCRAQ